MSFIPEFKIGLWNAWVLVLFFDLFTMIFSYFLNKKGFMRGADRSWIGGKEKTIMMFSFLSWFGILILSVWTPLKIGTAQFYAGITVYIIGLLLNTIAGINFVTAPLNKPITQGMYKLSRNPTYFLKLVCILGVSVSSASWMLFTLLAIYSLTIHFVVIAEEKYCLEKYGNAYRDYMKRVPRYFLFF